jgi:hypothetical protein
MRTQTHFQPVQKLAHSTSHGGTRTHRMALPLLTMIGLVLIAAPAFAQDCTLTLPPGPLTASGLSTPFILSGAGCDETSGTTGAFVGGAIYDPTAHTISVYNPLVISAGHPAAIPPTPITVPAGATVALWFGYDGNNLTLADTTMGADLSASHCVNGDENGVFQQFSYCNAVAFFAAANADATLLASVPSLGISPKDHQTCPSPRDFSVVDQDQSDNLPTSYLISGGQLAQDTPPNRAALTGAGFVVIHNPSDELLTAVLLDPLLGCTPWTVTDLADTNASKQMLPSLPTNELQSAMFGPSPIALVPANDPMTTDPELTIGAYDLIKVNLYREGVDQPDAGSLAAADPTAYCTHFRGINPAKLLLDKPYLTPGGSPNPAAASNLWTFLALRYVTSYGLLGCEGLLHLPVNLILTTTGGVVTNARGVSR